LTFTFVLPEKSSPTHYTNEENGLVLRRQWTNACQSCTIKQRCTTGKEPRITRWEHEHVLEAVQKRLDRNPQAMRQRRETAARGGRGLYSEVRDQFNLLVREGPHVIPGRE
jgi:hypothetical protein